MGNQLLKGYSMQGEPVSCVGCEKMWRIYQGTKTSTGKQVTIFAIEKKALNKSERDDLIKFAKKQALGLARIRHPGVLAISQTLIEDEYILAFSTEPVLGNLTMLSRQNKLLQIISNEIELRLNLFPLLDTIQFLHDNVKTAHLGIHFDNIYITKEGKWKVSGFSNSQIYSAQGLQDLDNFRCHDFSYSSPEVALMNKFQSKSDVYSLGIFITNLLQILHSRYNEKIIPSKSEYKEEFQKNVMNKVNNKDMEKMENYHQFKILMKNVLSRDPDQRMSLYQLSNSKWLNDKLVLAVRYLENITSYDSKQQIQFLKGLMGILNHFSNKILLRKVIPSLMELLKFKHLIPSVIYISIEILKDGKILKTTQFLEHIWPHIRKVVQGKQITANSLFLIVDNISLLERIVTLDQLTQTIMPLYIKCFDCPPKLKLLALHKTDYILSKMDYQFIKAKFLPKIMNCMKDSNGEVHKKSLMALRKCIKILDVQTITSQVLPGLENSRKAGTDPFINAISISIYTQLAKSLPTEILSSKLIPTILPYLTDPSVSCQDFYNYKKTLITILEKIQGERKKYWDENRDQTSQIAYSQKDFEFQEEKKVTQKQENQSGHIGGGDYKFLKNIGNQKSDQNQSSASTNNEEYSYNNNNSNNSYNSNSSSNRNQQYSSNINSLSNNNNINSTSNYNNYNDFNNSNRNNGSNVRDQWSPSMNLNDNRPQYGSRQRKPEENPRLKGPNMNKKLSGPENKPVKANTNNVFEKNIDYSDPWAALDSLVATKPINNSNTEGLDWNYGNSNQPSQKPQENWNLPVHKPQQSWNSPIQKPQQSWNPPVQKQQSWNLPAQKPLQTWNMPVNQPNNSYSGYEPFGQMPKGNIENSYSDFNYNNSPNLSLDSSYLNLNQPQGKAQQQLSFDNDFLGLEPKPKPPSKKQQFDFDLI